TSLSKHFMIVGVSATGRKSLRPAALECFGTGTMEVVLKHVGTAAWASDRLNISVKTSVSCPAQALSTRPGMPSGPAAFRALVLLSAAHTSVEESVRGWLSVVSAALMAASWLSLSNRA